MRGQHNATGIRSRSFRAIEPLESRLLLAVIRYVDINSPGPTHDGTSWDSAFTDLQQALAASGVGSGDQIRVADGTYKPTAGTDRTISFQLKTGVSLLGGHAGYGAADPNDRNISAYPTILSGDIGTAGSNSDNSYHVVVGSDTDATAVLDGFTITAGNANGGSAYSHGGGMSNFSSSPTLDNCTFSGNRASTYGGGMYNHSSSPTLTNCTFSANSESAMVNAYSSPTLTNCIFSGNSGGGGMYNRFASPTLTNCIIWGSGNSAINNYSSIPVITYSDIEGGYPGTGNIDADPLFVRSPWTGPDGTFGTTDDDYGDPRLRAGSPALDVGSNAAVPPGVTSDLAGNSRIQNGTVDLGAYEGITSAPAPKTLYVDLSAVGTNSGISWTNAFVSLQSALLAAGDGDTICVADGTYKPTATADRRITFSLRNFVHIYGGYAGYGAADPDARDIAANATVLSGDIGTASSNTDNSYHVLVGSGTTATAVLDGFTITAGNAYLGLGSFIERGGGMYNISGNPTVRECTFIDNYAIEWGGAVYNERSSPSLINCLFDGNCSNEGGAIYNLNSSPQVNACVFRNNSTDYEGGAVCNDTFSSPTFTDCTFSANYSHSWGGAVRSWNHCSPLFLRCLFMTNKSGGSGGALYNAASSGVIRDCTFTSNMASRGGAIDNSGSAPTIANCTFVDNCSGEGGAIHNSQSEAVISDCRFIRNGKGNGGAISNRSCSPTIENCVFNGNYGGNGGAVYNRDCFSVFTNCSFVGNVGAWGGAVTDYYASPTVVNCSFVQNSASFWGGAVMSYSSNDKFTNCVFWDNMAPDGQFHIDAETCTTTVAYCNVEGGSGGIGNIDATPLFVRHPNPGSDTTWGTADDDYGDLRLQAGSPCIDAGSNAAVPTGITIDLAGNPRFADVPGVKDPGVIVDMGAYEVAVPLAAGSGEYLFNAPRPSLKIAFNANLSLQSLAAADLVLLNLTSGETIDCGSNASVSYDQASSAATWAFGSILLPDGNYRATLPAGSVSDAGGQVLSSDFSFDFFVLAGDANRDRKVDVGDLGILASNWQLSPRVFSQADFNYDGAVNVGDLGILASNWQKTLEPPAESDAPLRFAAAALPAASSNRKTRTRLAETLLA